MDAIRRTLIAAAAVLACFAAYGQAEDCVDKAVCGEVSALIPMQSTEAVHMGLVWKKGSQKPKLLFHSRFPEYTPNDVADPAVVDAAIAAGALTRCRGARTTSPPSPCCAATTTPTASPPETAT